ncbi:hypothetical protein SAMN05428983_0554 [Agrobacterium fabrum]|uniref:Uncharacterized protein n=1 Tax=Agrobacterium fabrum TaxID=1176649 RepID=A0A7Z7BGK0_9HYPH|nr:hypothetical protein [Agrobacterium fabrum]SDJ18912.1 hypothetical protein SAMN05428983_0554 [Agrobacterium fabrum]
MTVLNIGGRRVTVDDSFKSLSPEQQSATVEEIAKTLGASSSQADQAQPAQPAQPTVKATVEKPDDPRDSFMGKVDSFVRGAADTLSFGLADEAAAAGDALFNPVFGTGKDGRSLSERYNANLEAQRATDAADSKDRFGYRLAGQIGGGVTGGVGLAKGGLSATANAVERGASLGRVAAASAGEGAVLGGAQGFGSGEQGFLNRLAKSGVGSLTGAGLGVAAPYAIAGGGSFLRSLASPITSRIRPDASANRAIGTALQRSGKSPEEIESIMRLAIDDGQGEYALVDALGHSGQRMLSAVARTPNDARQEVVGQLLTRQAGQGDRLANAIAEGFDATDTAAQRAAALTAARDAEANALYGTARREAGAVNVTPILEHIDETIRPGVNQIVSPRDRIANDSIEGALTRVRSMLSDGNSQVTDFNALFRAKLDLDDLIARSDAQGAGNRAFALNQVKRLVDTALEDASPAFRTANDTFRTRSGVIDAVAEGSASTSGRQRAADTIERFSQMTPDEQAAFRAGYADPLIARVESAAGSPTTNKARALNTPKNREEFQAIASPDQADQLGRRIGREQRMFETLNQTTGGSRTADNLADMDDIANFDPAVLTNLFSGGWKAAAIGAVTRALNEGKGLPPRVIEKVGRSLMTTDPEHARRLLTVAASTKMNDVTKRGMATAILNTLSTAGTGRLPGSSAKRAPLELNVPVPVR